MSKFSFVDESVVKYHNLAKDLEAILTKKVKNEMQQALTNIFEESIIRKEDRDLSSLLTLKL